MSSSAVPSFSPDAPEIHADPYPAFDVANQRVAKRLSRYKDKLRDHHRTEDPSEVLHAAYTTFQTPEEEAEGGQEPQNRF